jgi:hypothetical protein
MAAQFADRRLKKKLRLADRRGRKKTSAVRGSKNDLGGGCENSSCRN